MPATTQAISIMPFYTVYFDFRLRSFEAAVLFAVEYFVWLQCSKSELMIRNHDIDNSAIWLACFLVFKRGFTILCSCGFWTRELFPSPMNECCFILVTWVILEAKNWTTLCFISLKSKYLYNTEWHDKYYLGRSR